jgi:hypothetical protein
VWQSQIRATFECLSAHVYDGGKISESFSILRSDTARKAERICSKDGVSKVSDRFDLVMFFCPECMQSNFHFCTCFRAFLLLVSISREMYSLRTMGEFLPPPVRKKRDVVLNIFKIPSTLDRLWRLWLKVKSDRSNTSVFRCLPLSGLHDGKVGHWPRDDLCIQFLINAPSKNSVFSFDVMRIWKNEKPDHHLKVKHSVCWILRQTLGQEKCPESGSKPS